jgi:hypothetical protein
VWWLWVLGGLIAWTLMAFLLAVVIGRSIRLADQRSGRPGEPALTLVPLAAQPEPVAVRVRRRAVPLPAFGIALVVLALALETTGYVVRLTGSTGPSAQLLSMDAPFSLPRMLVALLFAAAALAAVAGAGSMPGRRTWWLAVGAVGGGIAAVKAGSTVHSQALHALNQSLGEGVAVLVSALAAVVVIGALWVLSRTERRDRRRVLGVLALYAGASVGLSALSSLAADVYGGASTWAIGATFVEETGEALAGVGFLMAVLVGVAPRVALPARWALRREADAHGLELPEVLPGRTAPDGAH